VRAGEAQDALVHVAETSNKTSNRLAWVLAGQAFLKGIAGAAALSDLIGTRTAGFVLIGVSSLDAAIAAYLAATNRNPFGSG
jgi:hypothetical protein